VYTVGGGPTTLKPITAPSTLCFFDNNGVPVEVKNASEIKLKTHRALFRTVRWKQKTVPGWVMFTRTEWRAARAFEVHDTFGKRYDATEEGKRIIAEAVKEVEANQAKVTRPADTEGIADYTVGKHRG